MKSIISIFFAVIIVALCFAGCASNIPEEPATTAVENHSYVTPNGETLPAPVNAQPDVSYPVEYVDKTSNIEFVISSYYVYGNSVASISNIEISDDGFSLNANGFLDVKMEGVGTRSDGMKIAYVAYDKDGNVVRNSHIQAKLDGVKDGDTVENRRFDVPRETVKIVFKDYVEPEEE